MLNLDFSQRVAIDTNRMDWVQSPMAGVWRKPLAREDAECGHATSIVRYEPGARFRAHDHPGGEEILVLEGVFSDETGDYEAGTYFRNPVGFRHAPASAPGCVLLVKLHQFQEDDTAHVVVNTRDTPFQPGPGGVRVLPLHRHGSERVQLVRWPAGAEAAAYPPAGGEEIYVITGELHDAYGRYPAGTWLRSPLGSTHRAGADTLAWVKTGHLPG